AGLCNLRVSYDAPPCAPLPVGLENFETKCENDQALLNWSTITESNSDYFTIWKSTNGIDFSEVAMIQTSENSSSQLDYRWIDPNTETNSAYYKLSQTDLNGTTEQFEVKLFNGCKNVNPIVFTDDTKSIHFQANHITAIVLQDNMGRTVLSKTSNGKLNEIILSSPSIITGVYTSVVTYDNGKQKTIKFVYSAD
ncbi:MAG: T9SS type A sorting domain-containing protein, partial [Crocinitomicaceae bacterium]|nr:T9SS type A sorting domain-containing protein [Crocinitomicaceae bacterium]